jgi:hypothetical protein
MPLFRDLVLGMMSVASCGSAAHVPAFTQGHHSALTTAKRTSLTTAHLEYPQNNAQTLLQRTHVGDIAALAWDPAPLDSHWWEPLRATHDSPDCTNRSVKAAVHISDVYGRTNNAVIEWVHAVAFVVSRPEPTVLVTDGVLETHVGGGFDLVASARGWVCTTPQWPSHAVTNVTLHTRDVFWAPENHLFGVLFRETALHQLLLRPRQFVRDAVLAFESTHNLVLGGYIAVHLRNLEGSCTRRSELHDSSVLRALLPPWSAAVHNATDICSMSHRYLSVVLAAYPGVPVVLAHDRQDNVRAADIRARFGAVSYSGPHDAFVDMQLLIRAKYLVGNPASSMSYVADSVRRVAKYNSNFDSRMAYSAGPGRSRGSLRQQLHHIVSQSVVFPSVAQPSL